MGKTWRENCLFPVFRNRAEMEAARKVARQHTRNKLYFHRHSGRPLTQTCLADLEAGETLQEPGKTSALPPRRCARASGVVSVGRKPRPSRVLRGGWEPRARATTLPADFPTAGRRKRGRKAWPRRRRRRERRRRWRRPLASVRWRRRWWRQWTGRPGLGQLEQLLAG